MKNNLLYISSFLLLMLILCISCKEQNRHGILDGNIETGGELVTYPKQIYFTQLERDSLTRVVKFEKEGFSIDLGSDEVLLSVCIKQKGKKYRTEFFTSKSECELTLEDGEINIEGSPNQSEYLQLLSELQVKKYSKLKYSNELSVDDSLFVDKYDKNLLSAILDNAQSIPLTYIVYNHFWNASLEVRKQVMLSFDSSVHNSYYLKKIQNSIVRSERVSVGKKVPCFAIKNEEGNNFNISSLEGKYVLIDFWASWCGPCRHEIPNLKKVYSEFHHKGLEIVSISVDENDKAWRRALKAEKMSWIQLRDVMISDKFNVTAIPHILLISPDGIILAKNLRGEKMRNKLKSIFK